MSYEELIEAREKRAEKDAAQRARAKSKRGRKRTSAVLEADAAELKTKKIRITKEPVSEPTAILSTITAVVEIETASDP